MFKKIKSKTLNLDGKAKSNNKNLPAFLARPKGSKIYHGFPLIKEITKEGFVYGSITDFMQKDSPNGCNWGDGFVEAPDGSRAGIVWEKGKRFSSAVLLPYDKERWGVYSFSIPFAIRNVRDMKRAFTLMLPKLKEFQKKVEDMKKEKK